MSEYSELIIDKDDMDKKDCLFLNPKHINGVKYCANNIFDHALIQNCPTEKLSAINLIGIYNSLKPGAELIIHIYQPISVMIEYDYKQIEANLKLVGFEEIKYEEKNGLDSKKGLEWIIFTVKPLNKENNFKIETTKNEKSSNINDLDGKGKKDKYYHEKKVEKVVEKREGKDKLFKGKDKNNIEDNNQIQEKEKTKKEEIREKPKRYEKYNKDENLQTIEQKEEIIIKKDIEEEEQEKNGQSKKPLKDKKEIENKKKEGLRKRYGKH